MTAVLVTGAAGFIGRAATAALESAGFEVMSVATRPAVERAPTGLSRGRQPLVTRHIVTLLTTPKAP